LLVCFSVCLIVFICLPVCDYLCTCLFDNFHSSDRSFVRLFTYLCSQMICRYNTAPPLLRMDQYRALYVRLLSAVLDLNNAFVLKLLTFCFVLILNFLLIVFIDLTSCQCFLYWNRKRELVLCLFLVISIGYFSRRLYDVVSIYKFQSNTILVLILLFLFFIFATSRQHVKRSF
jgi:hypothetical protein